MDIEDVPCIDYQGTRYPFHEFDSATGECINCEIPEDAYIEPYWDDTDYDYWE